MAISKEIPTADWSDVDNILKNEARVLHDLYLSGQVREFYFTEAGEAVIILECSSTDEARAALQQLPLVRHGLIGFDLTELRPYTGFSRLF